MFAYNAVAFGGEVALALGVGVGIGLGVGSVENEALLQQDLQQPQQPRRRTRSQRQKQQHHHHYHHHHSEEQHPEFVDTSSSDSSSAGASGSDSEDVSMPDSDFEDDEMDHDSVSREETEVDTFQQLPLSPPSLLLDLPPEVCLNVLQFLTLQETRTMMQVHSLLNKWLSLNSSSSGRVSNVVWNELAKQTWFQDHLNCQPFIPLSTTSAAATAKLPTTSPGNMHNHEQTQQACIYTHNPSKLLALARPLPHENHILGNLRLLQTLRLTNPPANNTVNNKLYYQYTGPIGQGDRSLRANAPLPRPYYVVRHRPRHPLPGAAAAALENPCFPSRRQQCLYDPSDDPVMGSAFRSYPYSCLVRSLQSPPASILQRLVLGTTHQQHSPPCTAFPDTIPYRVLRPFVVPRTLTDGSVEIAPRLVSYFEVEIRAPPPPVLHSSSSFSSATTTTTSHHHHHHHHHNHRHHPRVNCIAVGIATRDFRWQCRMPGWDSVSIGYHSDDGGLFFGSGTMQRQYGPQFALGDVVGCGVEYGGSAPHGSVFFTLNGKHLGEAVTLPRPKHGTNNTAASINEETITEDWYPVVGLDTNDLVHFNFTGPFAFDVQSYAVQKGHEALIRDSLEIGPDHHNDCISCPRRLQ